jgi:hypothetical protein
MDDAARHLGMTNTTQTSLRITGANTPIADGPTGTFIDRLAPVAWCRTTS